MIGQNSMVNDWFINLNHQAILCSTHNFYLLMYPDDVMYYFINCFVNLQNDILYFNIWKNDFSVYLYYAYDIVNNESYHDLFLLILFITHD